jgi:MoxR-like ATPase
MQERAVTAAGERFLLDKPFFVLATQNPIEQEGTYPLPEAQLDRFMFSVWLDYPEFEDELTIVRNTTSDYSSELKEIMSAEEIKYFQKLVLKIPINEHVLNYAVALSAKTRPGTKMADPISDKYLKWGAGPRASQYLVLGAKTHAVLSGKYSPDIEDVKAVAKSILRHRIIKNYKAEAENISVDQIIGELL